MTWPLTIREDERVPPGMFILGYPERCGYFCPFCWMIVTDPVWGSEPHAHIECHRNDNGTYWHRISDPDGCDCEENA